MTTVQRTEALINRTHSHGLQLEREIADLQKRRPPGYRMRVRSKQVLLKVLKNLNRRRWVELAEKKHQAQFTMYDAADGGTFLPTNMPPAVAGYIDGRFRSYDELVRRYPHAKHLKIAVFASSDAHCLDIETGDATPAEAPGWVRRQHKRGLQRPILYANTSTMPQVVAALSADHIRRSEYLLWTAHYTGTPHIESGSDATQWANVERPGHNYDVSLCQPWFL